MSLEKFTGTGVALITPFHKDGRIHFKSLENLLENLIESKVDYLVPLGTTGESATLNKDERSAILGFVKEINNKRLPVVYGLGGNNTQDIIDQMRNTDFENIDAILSVCPYYNKPSQKGIYQHYKMIATASPVPVILYNVPGRTGTNMTAETTLSLAHDVENISGIKEASGNLEQCMAIIKDRPKGFLMISGDDALAFPLIALGGEGVISVVANAFPKEFAEMVRLAMQGDYSNAREIHYKMMDIIPLLFNEGNPAGVKAALNILGMCPDHLRLPLMNVSKNLYNQLSSQIKNIHEKVSI
jgi:4-hydroxy-tetrahydrodipicolinate synthase